MGDVLERLVELEADVRYRELAATGVPSAQLELHTSLRVVERREDATLPAPFHGDSGRIRRVVRALVHLVGLLSSEETTEGRVHDA